MAIHRCTTNGTVDDTGYSSPVPVIGLYIAAASLLCVLLMLCDIVAGLRARKRWLPCKLFTLNSVTLTLLSVAAKLPVDLTSSMPSSSDQLSKLSGTTFICISMCFLIPSLGVNPASESFTNMVALTIFVVTIFVNICMQLSTGVIALFFTEHIIILCSLLVLILIMWQSYLEITNTKKIHSEFIKEIFTNRQGSVFHRLRYSYMYGYRYNLHLLASFTDVPNYASSMICTLCCGTLIQAAFRSVIRKELKLCSGNSDYDWSMPLILAAQILTVITGSSAVIFRFLTMSRYSTSTGGLYWESADNPQIQRNPILGKTSRLEKYGTIVRHGFLWTITALEILIGFIPLTAYGIFFALMPPHDLDVVTEKWAVRKSEEDVEKWIDQNRSEPSTHLSQLLTSQNYPQHQFDTMEVIDPSLPRQKGVYVSSLSILLLVRIAQVSLPENRSTSLVKAFNEAKEVFYYTEKNITPKSLKNDNKLWVAKSVWAGQEFSCLLPEIFDSTINPPTQTDLARALSIITELKAIIRQLKATWPSDPVWDELGIIVDFITRKTYSTVQELITSVEQLFVDMVRVMLSQIPQAIFKSLNNSTDEKYGDNVKFALKITCKVESFEGHIQWSFPPGLNFTSLANTEADLLFDAISQV